jgi:hypothetical protein
LPARRGTDPGKELAAGRDRPAIRDTQLAGQKIAEGDKIIMFYSSANRDEEVFATPHGSNFINGIKRMPVRFN